MTEKEKGKAGLFYNLNYDSELTKEREWVKDRCFENNNIPPSHREERKALMKEILGGTKGEFLIESPFNCDYGYNTFIGENFYANHGLVLLDTARVTIGDNVWIGGNVAILPGVTVGSNVVIGARSVVTKDIPSGVVAAGNPCRVIRPITAEDKGRFLSVAQRKTVK